MFDKIKNFLTSSDLNKAIKSGYKPLISLDTTEILSILTALGYDPQSVQPYYKVIGGATNASGFAMGAQSYIGISHNFNDKMLFYGDVDITLCSDGTQSDTAELRCYANHDNGNINVKVADLQLNKAVRDTRLFTYKGIVLSQLELTNLVFASAVMKGYLIKV